MHRNTNDRSSTSDVYPPGRGNYALDPDSIPSRPPVPPPFVRDSVSHESRPKYSIAPFYDSISWQGEKCTQQASAPEPTESGNEPSDVLLQNFPPLIPRREPQQDRHGLVENETSNSNNQDQPNSGPMNVVYPFFRKGHAYPSVRRYSAPRPHPQKESILSQQLNALPGGSLNLHHTQNDSTLIQQPNTLPEFQDRRRFADTPEPSAIFPTTPAPIFVTPGHTTIHAAQIQQEKADDAATQDYGSFESLNRTTRTLETYGTWSEDPLLRTAASATAQTPSSRSSSVSDQSKPAPQAADLFQLYQDIPEHKDPRTAVKIMNCVEKLKEMGCGSQVDGGDARLVVYAQAAGGSLEAALDIMEEERQAYAVR